MVRDQVKPKGKGLQIVRVTSIKWEEKACGMEILMKNISHFTRREKEVLKAKDEVAIYVLVYLCHVS